MNNILHIDASGRHGSSFSRTLSAQIVDKIKGDGSRVTSRDVSQGLPYVDDIMIESYYTQENQRSDTQKQAIEVSNAITQELLENDVYVIGLPVYNFSMPAGFKAWSDLAARVGVTFEYGATGPNGLLEGKKAYVVITSGGTQLDSEIDFLTPWLRHYLSFIGVSDIEVINSGGLGKGTDKTLENAKAHIAALI